MEGEEISDREADDERRQPHHEAEVRGRDIGPEDGAEVWKLREAALEILGVTARREARDHLKSL
jgi:hypothetical protein